MGIDNYTDVKAGNIMHYYVPLVPCFNGYSCGTCGAWVAYGEYHVCHGYFESSWITTGTKPIPLDLQRIAAALERIADALEKIK